MKRYIPSTVLIALLVMSLSAVAWAQHDHTAAKNDAPPNAMADGSQMMGEHMQQMQSMMKKMDQQLDEKVKAMNQANGDAKIAAMADVINELVSQRKQMHKMMHGKSRSETHDQMWHEESDHAAPDDKGHVPRQGGHKQHGGH